MPDDNSCLFRAFGTAVVPGDDMTMPELRSLVASAIQSQPETYTQVVLEQPPDDYCRWIQTPDAWGGAVEMGILAQHFDIEICSIDVKVVAICHPCAVILNFASLCEWIGSTKVAQHAVSSYILVYTTIPSYNLLPTTHIPKQTRLLNLTNESGTLTTTISY